MDHVGYKINEPFKRADRRKINLVQGLPTSNINDCMGRMAAVSSAIRPVGCSRLLGSAFTVRVPQGDNLMLHIALDYLQDGDVLMIDAGGATERSILGEIIVSYCMARGSAGIVVDGSIRDSGVISQLNYPVFCRGVTSDGPYKNGPGEIGCDVVIGGRVVHPGDIIVGDDDGVIVIRPEEAEHLSEMTKGIAKKEQEIISNIRKHHSYPRPWLDEKLHMLGISQNK